MGLPGVGVGEIVLVDPGPRGEQDHALDQVLELADVARPGVTLEGGEGGGGQAQHGLAEPFVAALHEVGDQERQVLDALAQRGQVDRDDVEPVVEVLPEVALLDQLLEAAVGRGDQAYVYPQGLHAADALEFRLLNGPQQLDLDLLGDLADLVEEQGAAVGELEAAGPARHGAGEGAALVAKQLAFDQAGRDGRAVDLDEGLVVPRRAEVQRPGDQLLAGAALGGDEHGRGAGSDGSDDLADRLHLRGASDHAGVGAGISQVLGQRGRGRGRPGPLPRGDRLLHDLVDLVAVEGLLQVVEGAELHGLDRRVDAAVRGQQDHRQVRLVQRQRAQ